MDFKHQDLICCQCQIPLEMVKTNFLYMRHSFSSEAPRCPKCGQIFIPEELINSKVIPVEQLLEDK